MPVWHNELRDLVDAGKLQMIGIIQEQHAERCRLFAQWHDIDWPILHDPINVVGVRAVPMFIAIDADGIVRNTHATTQWVRDTLMSEFATPTGATQRIPAVKPDFSKLKDRAKRTFGPGLNDSEKMELANLSFLWDKPADFVGGYMAIDYPDRKDPAIWFRNGVASLRAWELFPTKNQTQFADALASWERALELDPNHYIYRRRLQQYGPRLSKPYPFYDWVVDAQAAIRKRGDTPIALTVPLTGSELASPSRRFESATNDEDDPDPFAKIDEDTEKLISISLTSVPIEPTPGEPFRLHVSLLPGHREAHWNNETPPTVVWLYLPDDWDAEKQLLRFSQAGEPESRERRAVDLELKPPASASRSEILKGYALYYVCEEQGGQCLYLRQPFEFELRLNAGE